MSKKEESKKAKKNGFSKGIGSLLNGSFLTRQLVQNNMPFIFFLVFIMICYISYGYFAEQNAKDLVQAESELREVKAANLSVNARLEKRKQQSEVAKDISELGLKESTEPPKVIRLPKQEAD
ncbi:MAG: hypothetical protein MK086_01295 [Flavobacteriales bacterium]|nr:hypothetical protein [Flavobacteriales bacterium]